jgi:hypothetical protein
MAIVRCKSHPPDASRVKEAYAGNVDPHGLTHSGLVCGRVACEGDGLIWLTKTEAKAYENGTRIFGVKTHSVKVRTSDGSIRI